MKNKFTKLIAMLLVVCMMFSFSSVAMAAVIDDVVNTDDGVVNYVSIGASNVNGYGMRGYLDEDVYEYPLLKETANIYGYKQDTPGSYPVLFKEYFEGMGHEVELSQLALSSMRAEEVRFLLDDTYTGDAYTDWRFCDVPGYDARASQNWFYLAGKLEWEAQGNSDTPTQEQAVQALKDAYKDAIENADLITVDIGINNFGVYASNQIVSNMYENDLNTIDPELAAIYAEGKAYVMEVLNEKAGDALTAMPIEALDHMADTMAYALVGFCLSFDAVMEQIYALNPDANVVVVSIQNLMYGLNAVLPGIDAELPFGDIFGALINAANVYTAAVSEYSNKYVYADVRQSGHVEFFSDELLAYNGDPATLSLDMKDCFDVYDDNLYIKARVQQVLAKQLYDARPRLLDISAASSHGLNIADNLEHFAIAYQNQLLTIPALGITFNEFFAAGAAGNLPDAAQPYYDGYVVALNTAYDVMAEIMQAGVAIETLDASAFGQRFGPVEDALLGAFFGTLENAVMKSIADPTFMFDLNEYYPDGIFKMLAADAGLDEGFVNTVAVMGIRTGIGNSFYGHPNGNGHMELRDAIIAAMAEDITGEDVLVDEIILAANQFAAFVAEYYDEAYAYAYDYAYENGYIKEANDAIDAAIAAFAAIDHEGIGMSEELAEEIAADIAEIIETLEAAKALLNEADELDAASLDALLALLNEAAELGEELLGTLEQAGVDVNEYVIIPALNEAYRILVEEVIPQIDRQLQIAVQAGTDWLMEKAGEAYAAFLAALPEIDEALYNYFYNNPEEVIAFFAEYGDEIGVLFAEYGDELFAVLGYIAYYFGEDVLDYVMTHPCETIEFFVKWYEKYGERTWAMIHVYADALGICQCENIDEIVADLVACGTEYVEAVLEALKAHIAEELADEIAYIEALIEQIKNAADDLKDQVTGAVTELTAKIEAAVAELQAKLAELVANYQAELYDATHVVYDTCPENHVYVSLGGAVAFGDGLGRNDKTYAELFKDVLDENVENVTLIDCTAADLDINGLAAYIMDKAEAIYSADIITYNLDAAGILDAILAGDEFVNNWAAYASAEDVAKADMIIAEINKLLAEQYDPEIIAIAEELVETVVYATVAFGVESYKAIETIRAINPDAAVLAVGMYNPFAGMTVTANGEVLPIGEYFDYAIEATNLYYELYAIATDNFTFVEADEAEVAAAIEIVIEAGMDYLTLVRQLMGANAAMLATAEGHEYINDCIVDAVIFEGHNFVYIETIDPTYTAKGYDIYECSKCGAIEYRNFTEMLEIPVNPTPVTPVAPVVPEKYECDGGDDCPCRRFTDLDPTQWYHYGVDYMILKGIMIGIGDGQFAPFKAITRAEVAMMLWRLEGTPEATIELNFSDVAADAWYTEAVRWAVESETFLGYGDGTFGPNDIITREQLAAVMCRYAGECGVDISAEKSLADFTDADDVSAWAVDSLEWAYAVEMMIGTGDGKMSPLGDANRATIATVFHRYIENILKLVIDDVKLD